MIQDFFTPISAEVLSYEETSKEMLGRQLVKHTDELGFPDLENVNLAFFDVREERGAVGNQGTGIGADEIRKQLYQLYGGNWDLSMVDLGSIQPGNQLKDTYFAVQETVDFLLKNNVLPIIIGGGQDLIYANYRGYNQLDQAVNLAVASPKFSFGDIQDELNSNSYLSKIILEQPCNLFNYANLGYQTYYNSQEEISLIENLSFEAYRVGALKNISIVEPVMRDADIVAIDMGVVRCGEAPANGNANPNGLYGDDLCAIARYAGISDKVTSFGIYEYNKLFDVNHQTSKLISQVIWYFIEGYSLRTKDYPYGSKDSYLKYLVPFENEVISFYQSDKSQRWWMQVDIPTQSKYKRHVLVPCSYDDYLNTIEQKVPERWFNVHRKIS
ncbi:formimidoylglutamase [Wenyingzhuangia marina]|uniref:Arginase family enzyme n=1 Tax=Wenyingzhuangia marina TaxID=1195760 RepID=A0A1M5T6Q1_9FLAO|nr:formimidoylglutamase [Wenyingzhuangia marina]GGF65613.1 arginase [Wenyingzhuangia marina]SHH46409.1 Arginase family enzyme [Wenyingzhuangia marina]